jgi:phospholipid/cholesterol/gamma-HCH transport system substrate-binding protein
METKVNYAAVGAFVLVLAAALIAGVLWLASGGSARQQMDLYLAVMEESVSGLNINAPVKYNGVDVGMVRDIQLDPSAPQRVRLVFAIRRGTPIKEDTEAVLRTQGLTGIAYVELSGGTPGSPPLRATAMSELPVIRTKPSLGARLENVLTTVLVKLNATTTRIDAILSKENERALSDTLANLAAVSHTLAARKDTIDAGLLNAARTLDHGARLTAQLSAQIGPVVERVGRAADSLDKMGQEAGSASTQAGTAVTAVSADLQRFGTQTLPGIQGLLGELQATSASLRRLVEQTERHPSGLLFGRSPVPEGPGESPSGATKP